MEFEQASISGKRNWRVQANILDGHVEMRRIIEFYFGRVRRKIPMIGIDIIMKRRVPSLSMDKGHTNNTKDLRCKGNGRQYIECTKAERARATNQRYFPIVRPLVAKEVSVNIEV
jgi:hypothetical protein